MPFARTSRWRYRLASNDGWEHALTDMCPLHDYSPPAGLARNYRTVEAALGARAGDHAAYDPGFGYRGEPVLVTEFGGLRLSGSGGWGYNDARDPNPFLNTYRGLTECLSAARSVAGFG